MMMYPVRKGQKHVQVYNRATICFIFHDIPKLSMPGEFEFDISQLSKIYVQLDTTHNKHPSMSRVVTFIGCLHNPANFQQSSSISTCILNTFAGSLLDRVNTPLVCSSILTAIISKQP